MTTRPPSIVFTMVFADSPDGESHVAEDLAHLRPDAGDATAVADLNLDASGIAHRLRLFDGVRIGSGINAFHNRLPLRIGSLEQRRSVLFAFASRHICRVHRRLA